ncbi:MAG: tRNA guanosine(34) transglycosylase Tgt [Deltaproteobacteria bacterium]|nr:MAG: tRNA guanosine(34) transglycosylase Tgt [Deltaproteobacteria bacterium]
MGGRPSGLRGGRASPLSLLQLRRRHVDHVSAGFRFEVVREDPSGARLGRIETLHGSFETPAFMPVATLGSVKGLTPRQLEEVGAEIVLANAYHLVQRPGVETVQALGGLHALMGWRGPILTDSGGYQLMSLADLVRVEDEGVHYRSHVDGRAGLLRPEDAVTVQEALGVDIAMSLDECVPSGTPRERIARAVDRTGAWAARGLAARTRPETALFGIVQGGLDVGLRTESAAGVTALDFDGYAVGGLSVGEPPADTARVAAVTVARLPRARPRYLMGVGTDCVLPTRNARNGMLFTRDGKLVIRNARYARDPRPVEEGCVCYTCGLFSRGALRHLVLAREMLGAALATLHNLHFYLRLMREFRAALREGTFPSRGALACGAWA